MSAPRRRGAAQRKVLRLLDANANRALEGLRVCEDIARFHLSEGLAVRRIRSLRHALAEAMRALPVTPGELIGSRDTRCDPGRAAPGGAVDSLERLLLINFQRAKESLRTLEECSRVIAASHAATFQRLRFQIYDTERTLLLRLAAVRHH